MYLPRYHRLDDPRLARSLMRAQPLATWICVIDGDPVVNHIPFHLDDSRGPHGCLIGHVSRANPVWRALTPACRSVAVFHGPQAYVTPSWYPGKVIHGEVVPTWDYAVVHAHGPARAIEDPAWLRAMLDRLTDDQERTRPAPWQVSDAPPDYVDTLMRAIVGIEIPIERLDSKLKASQDEAPADRVGTVAGLRARNTGSDRAMADLVEQHDRPARNAPRG